MFADLYDNLSAGVIDIVEVGCVIEPMWLQQVVGQYQNPAVIGSRYGFNRYLPESLGLGTDIRYQYPGIDQATM